MKPRRRRFLPGTPVRHARHGAGIVLGEWGPVEVVQPNRTTWFASCLGIYDVAFGAGAGRHLHPCRIEFLERI